MRPPEYSRRHCLQVALLGAAVLAGTTAPAATLPGTASLPQALALALKAGRPLLVMVSLEGCPFCMQVRDSHLAPLREREGLAVVQLDMRNKQAVVNFDGRSMTQDELIRRWGVTVAPTVLFFGRGGAEIAERMVGGYIPDFYGSYLDDRLRIARAALRA